MSLEEKALTQLTSWKEIAERLHVAVRTAQAWEHEKGLPVHRMPGEKGRVAADPMELDQWRRLVSRGGHWWSNLAYLRTYTVLSTVSLMIAVVYLSIHFLAESHHEPFPGFRNGVLSLVVTDHEENTPLKKVFPQGKESDMDSEVVSALHRKITFLDFDADGKLETLLDYSPVNLPRNFTSSYCSSGGENIRVSAPTRLSEVHEYLPGTRSDENLEAWSFLCESLLRNRSKEQAIDGREFREGTIVSVPPQMRESEAGSINPHCAHCEDTASFRGGQAGVNQESGS